MIDSIFPVRDRTTGVLFDAFHSNPAVNNIPLETIRVPALFVHSEDDTLASYEAAQAAAARIAGARLVTHANGGHLMLGQDAATRAELERFLAQPRVSKPLPPSKTKSQNPIPDSAIRVSDPDRAVAIRKRGCVAPSDIAPRTRRYGTGGAVTWSTSSTNSHSNPQPQPQPQPQPLLAALRTTLSVATPHVELSGKRSCRRVPCWRRSVAKIASLRCYEAESEGWWMFVAVRDLRFAWGRFVLMGSVIALVAVLTVLLSRLAAGLVDSGISGLRAMPLTHIAFEPKTDSTFSRRRLTRGTSRAWPRLLVSSQSRSGSVCSTRRTARCR